MLPVNVVRRLLKIRYHVKRNRLFQLSLFVLALVVVFAIMFMWFEGVDFFTAVYWAVITMSTIGYGDVTPGTYWGRLVAMIAAFAGIASFTALVSLIAEFFISASIRRMMGMHRVRYSGHYVVIGTGSSVSNFVSELLGAISIGDAEERPIVVVLPNDDERRKADLPEGVEVLVGEPTNRETLERAGVPRASYVVLALGNDSTSVFTTLLVRQISKAKVLVEAIDAGNVPLLKGAGAERVVVSRGLAGRLLASAIFEPEVVDVLEDLTSATEGHDIGVIDYPAAWGRRYSEVLSELAGEKKVFPIGYVLESPVLGPGLDEVIPEGARLIVIKRVR